MKAFIRPRSAACHGFSLVEVALAVAIAALGIITCLGLLPEGLEMSRQTGQLTINRNIIEQIIRDLENSPNWRVIKPRGPKIPLVSYASGASGGGGGTGAGGKLRSYYNNQGSTVKSDDTNITYVAEVDFDGIATLPGSPDDQPYLARVVIRMASTTRADFAFDPTKPATYATFHHLIAKTR